MRRRIDRRDYNDREEADTGAGERRNEGAHFCLGDQGEPRMPLARSPGSARGVTAVLIGSSAWSALSF